MNDVLDNYEYLLKEVDGWFDACLSQYPGMVACRQGCSACCRGLFDITLLDALVLKRGFDLLPLSVQEEVQLKSAGRLAALREQWPEFTPPWTLNHIPEPLWDDMMPEDDDTPCPLLSVSGGCLVYANRPMTCRLNGIPLIDISGEELFDDWCTRNFSGVDPLELPEIRHSFSELFAQELLLFRELTRRVFGKPVSELDTIIPAAVFLDDDMLRSIRLHDQV